MLKNKCVFFFLDLDQDAYNPDLKSGLSPKFKSRYVKTDFFGQNEIDIINRLKMLPNYMSHFHTFQSAEMVKIAELSSDKFILQTVNVIKDDNNMLLRYVDEKLIYIDGFFRSLSCSRKYIYTLTNFYSRILSSINLLVRHNIIHNNIGFKSIVVNSFEVPILTNFRFSLDLKSTKIRDCLNHIFIVYNPKYIYWPPEIHLLCYVLTNKLASLSLNNVETILSNLGLNEDNVLLSYFSKYVNQSCDQIITDILQFSGTWDQYAFGICYLKLIGDLQKNIKTSNNFVIMFLNLLQETVNIIPWKRQSVSNTITKYNQLLEECNINDLCMLVKAFE